MRIEDLPTFKHEIADGISALAVLLINLPVRHDTKTDPPKARTMVLVGWREKRIAIATHSRYSFFDPETIETFDPQPDWWCELLIPPPLPEGKP